MGLVSSLYRRCLYCLAEGLKVRFGCTMAYALVLLAHVTDSLPLRDELLCRTAMFVSKCVDSENNAVKFVSGHGVYFSRVSSPIGLNA